MGFRRSSVVVRRREVRGTVKVFGAVPPHLPSFASTPEYGGNHIVGYPKTFATDSHQDRSHLGDKTILFGHILRFEGHRQALRIHLHLNPRP